MASAAVIISLTITVAKDLFGHDINLTVFRVIFVITLGLLFVAAGFAVASLWPPGSYAASVEEVEDYLSDETLQEADPETARSLISGLHYELARTRDANDSNSKWLRVGLALMLMGALGTGLLGATLGLSSEKVRKSPVKTGVRIVSQPVEVRPSGRALEGRADG